MKKKEITALTGIRGIAALYVLVHHYFAIISYDLIINQGGIDLSTNNYFHALLVRGYLSVDLFFILSAFVMCYVYYKTFYKAIHLVDYKEFMMKRFTRLYPLYMVMLLIGIFINNPKLSFIPINFLFLQPFFPSWVTFIDGSWSLATEWTLYLIFPLLCILFNKMKARLFFILSILFSLFSYIIIQYMAPVNIYSLHLYFNTHHSYDGFIGQSDSSLGLNRCLCGYLLGIYIYKLYETNDIISKWAGKYIFHISLVTILLLGLQYTEVLIPLLFAVLILGVTENNRMSTFLKSKFSTYLGNVFYSLYLIYISFLKVSYLFLKHFGLKNLEFPIKLLDIAIVFALSTLSYKFLEIRSARYLKRIFRLN